MFVNKMGTETDIKTEQSTVFGWIFEYCCYIFWEEFQENFTVDSPSERRLLEGLSGIPMYSVECTCSRNRLAHFVSLLTHLADGLEYNIQYDNTDECGTPLEGALDMLHSLMESVQDNDKELEDAVNNLDLDIKTEAVLVCCHADDFNAAEEVYERLWARKEVEELSRAEKGVKATLESVLKKKSTKQLPSSRKWEKFQKRTIKNLSVIYDDMGLDQPFLHKASSKFLDAKRRRSSTISAPSKESNTPNVRLIPLGRLQGVGIRLGCTNFEDDTTDVTDIITELRDVREKDKKTPVKKSSHPAVSPIQVNNNNDESMHMSDDEMVTSTPHPNATKDRLSADVQTENASSTPARKDRPSTSKEETRKDRPSTSKEETQKDRPSTSKEETWRDRPSTSKENPRRERSSNREDETRRDRQSSSKERQATADVDNKENNSPKKGKQIRDQVYQPGRVTRSKDTPPKQNKNKYIEWLSSDDDEDDNEEDNKPYVFKAKLPHKRLRRSLDLDDGPIQYHKIRKPAQRVPWTADEEEKLRKGVDKYGKGNWAKIKDKMGFVIRTSVNLKDKWRNMEKDQRS